MDAYVAMGCRPTWTCAPYQLPERPAFGTHVAWAESNADRVRELRAGRAHEPLRRLHRHLLRDHRPRAGRGPAPRRGTARARSCSGVEDVPDRAAGGSRPRTLRRPHRGRGGGHARSRRSWGSPRSRTTEDHLKALGAAAASSGAVAMFHAVGITPEAPTLDAAPAATATATRRHARRRRPARGARRAEHGRDGRPDRGRERRARRTARCAELERLAALVGRRRRRGPVLREHRPRRARRRRAGADWSSRCEAAGVTIVSDTCTYITPIRRRRTAR